MLDVIEKLLILQDRDKAILRVRGDNDGLDEKVKKVKGSSHPAQEHNVQVTQQR